MADQGGIRDGAGAGPRGPWILVLQLLAATAGLLAFVTLVGGAMAWARFDALDLPADQAVAVLPRSLLVTIGARALVGPVVIGLLAVLFLYLIAPLDDGGAPRLRLWIVLILLLLVQQVVVAWLVVGLDWVPEWVVMGATSVLAVALILLVAYRTEGFAPLGWALFAAFAVVGGVLGYVRTTGQPKMEPAAALLKESRRAVGGFYVGQTSDRLYLVALPEAVTDASAFNEHVDRLVELPREQVTRLVVRQPVGVGPADEGGDLALALVQDLEREQTVALGGGASTTAAVTASNPAAAFAPLVHLHSQERFWPARADFFLEHSWLAWAHEGDCPDYLVALDRHAANPANLREQVMGRFEPGQLGRKPAYAHTRGAGRECGEAGGRPYEAGEHTRPFDPRGRPGGLGEKEGFYLDLWDAKREGERRFARRGARTILEGTPAYYEQEAIGPGGRDGLRITYWLFYALSRPPGPRPADLFVHEGDWERISVRLRRGPVPGQWVPISARYHFHDESRELSWSQVRRVAVGDGPATHPVAYGARGSHASYPREGRFESVFKLRGRRRFAVDDVAIACPRCPQWQTWRLLRDVRGEPWYGFGGAWGQVGTMAGTTGPLGPSPYKLDGLEEEPEEVVRQVAAPGP